MSIVNAVPSVWAAKILAALDTLLVYGAPGIMNTDYEGNIANVGDTVKIVTLGDVEVQTYTKNANINQPEALTDAELSLTVDQAKYFNFQIDDIDYAQAIGGIMDEAASRAAYGMRKVMDSFYASHFTDIDIANIVGSEGAPKTGFSANSKLAYNELVKLKTLLDITDTPEDERWVVVPPWFEAYLFIDDRAISFGTPANVELMQEGSKAAPNGLIGRAAGFNVYRSNQVPNIGGIEKFKIIAGHSMAWSRATQLLKTVAYEPEGRFADAMKGLAVYGAKVLRPSNMAMLIATDA